jgi:hypothetical protein
MKKLTGKQLRLAITLIIVIIFALSYEYIYLHFVDMAGDYKDKTELVNAQISQRMDELGKEDMILTDTQELNSQIEEILTSFPITLTKEENLLFIETMEKDLRMEISPLTISDPSIFHTTKLPVRDESGNEILVPGETSQTVLDKEQSEQGTEGTTGNDGNASATAEDTAAVGETTITEETAVTNEAASNNDTAIGEGTGQQYMTVLQSSINITFQTTYPKFKKVLEYIRDYPEKISVSNATLSYDSSTGDLLAVMTITRYAMTGTGKKYEEPYIGDISIGTDNIFGDPLED